MELVSHAALRALVVAADAPVPRSAHAMASRGGWPPGSCPRAGSERSDCGWKDHASGSAGREEKSPGRSAIADQARGGARVRPARTACVAGAPAVFNGGRAVLEGAGARVRCATAEPALLRGSPAAASGCWGSSSSISPLRPETTTRSSLAAFCRPHRLSPGAEAASVAATATDSTARRRLQRTPRFDCALNLGIRVAWRLDRAAGPLRQAGLWGAPSPDLRSTAFRGPARGLPEGRRGGPRAHRHAAARRPEKPARAPGISSAASRRSGSTGPGSAIWPRGTRRKPSRA
jgi:hypothetical protein